MREKRGKGYSFSLFLSWEWTVVTGRIERQNEERYELVRCNGTAGEEGKSFSSPVSFTWSTTQCILAMCFAFIR
jgi:hypothetical protein